MTTRRQFLSASLAAVAPSDRVTLAAASPPPSDRVTLGCVGLGWQGIGNLQSFLQDPAVLVVAVCDVDAQHLEKARELVNAKYGDRGCAVFHNYEELYARADIDAVSLALPDHWHGIASVAAARAGKDIYGEKPLAHDWAEGRAIADAVRRYHRVWQTGSWQRSVSHFRFACELVRNGRIGKVHRVEVGLPGGHSDFDGLGHLVEAGPPPAHLDYERWLGPAPYAPYCPARVHKTWRWNLDYGGGQLLDWIGHHTDIAHWGLDLDHTGPVFVEGSGALPPAGSLWDSPTRYRIHARYAGGLEMTVAGGHRDIRGGTKWIGSEGWVWVNRGGLEADPPKLLTSRIGPNEMHLERTAGHQRQFIECVRSRRATLTPAETALRSATPGYLGLISILTGRPVRWDPVAEHILEDPEAERLLAHPMRSPYHL